MSQESESERKFLHDMAGVLSTAVLYGNSAIEEIEQLPRPHPDLAVSLAKVNEALLKLVELIEVRRQYIKSKG